MKWSIIFGLLLIEFRTQYPKIWHSSIFNILSWRTTKGPKQESHSGLILPQPIPLLPWKQEMNLPCERWNPACNTRREGICIIWHRELRTQKAVYTNFVKLTLSFLVTPSSCNTPSPNPFVLSIFHKFVVSLSKGYKGFWFFQFFGSSFSCEVSNVYVPKKKKKKKNQ